MTNPKQNRQRMLAYHAVGAAHRTLVRAGRRLRPDLQPRTWSNAVLRDLAAGVTGDVVHVSAWTDDDKDGTTYESYFSSAASYIRTNYGGTRGEVAADEIELDLSAAMPAELVERFDFVFNHTTLEHIFDAPTAVKNLFQMSRREVFLVAPFMQIEHWEKPSFGDYWRYTRHGLIQATLSAGFEVVALESNHNPFFPIYYCLHARRTNATLSEFWDVEKSPPGFGSRPVASGDPTMQ